MPVVTAKDVLQRFSHEFPVDPVAIAERLGMTVLFEDYWREPGLSDDLSGRACHEGERPVIGCSAGDHELRQRFTLAHEIGHHMLGHTANGQVFRDTTKNFNMNGQRQEVEANAFAAELLMPEKMVRHFVLNQNVRDLHRLADLFNVSQPAMSYRLRNLGIPIY